MKQSKHLLAVIAGQSSVVAILVLVLTLAVAGAPILQQKQVMAQSIGTEVAVAKAYALSEALLANQSAKPLDTFSSASNARHYPGALDPGARLPEEPTAATAIGELRKNPSTPFNHFYEAAGSRHLFYGVFDRHGGALLIDLSMERE